MKALIAANWKMNPSSRKEAGMLFSGVLKAAKRFTGVGVVVFPPTIYLAPLRDLYRGDKVSLGAQDAFWKENGPHTGETGLAALRDLNVSYLLVGHSERRARGETNEDVARKLRGALGSGITPILCVGERARDSHGHYLAYLKDEVMTAFSGLAVRDLQSVIIAYEPIWAIGKTAADAVTPSEFHEIALYIRKIVAELFGRSLALAIPVLYGGSVEESNAEALITVGGAQGFLVGHASLDPDSFGAILRTVNEVRHVSRRSR